MPLGWWRSSRATLARVAAIRMRAADGEMIPASRAAGVLHR
jgi:hypothetical protein